MFQSAQAQIFRVGCEKTPFVEYGELRARYDDLFGKGEDNPFHRSNFFDAEEDKLLLHVVACGRVFYELLGRKPSQFDQLVELLVRGYFSRDLALYGAAKVLKELYY